MSRRSFIVVFCILLIVLSVKVVTAESQNLLVNGDFEGEWIPHASIQDSLIPEGWVGTARHDKIEPSPIMKVVGNSAVKVVSSAAGSPQIMYSDIFQVQPGATYKLSYWAHVETGGVTASLLDATANVFLSDSRIRLREEDFGSGEWRFFETIVQSPIGCEGMKLVISQLNPRSSDTTILYIDDIKVVKVN